MVSQHERDFVACKLMVVLPHAAQSRGHISTCNKSSSSFDFIDSDGFEVVAFSTSSLLEDDDAVIRLQGSNGCLNI